MKKIAMLMIIAVMALSAQANMTYAPFLLGGLDKVGNAIADGTCLVVIDLDGDGWDGVEYDEQAPAGTDNASSWSWDADDMVLDVTAIGGTAPGIATPFKSILTSEIPATYDVGVDEYFVLWFDVAFDAMVSGPGVGVDYGVELLGTVGKDPGNYAPNSMGGLATLVTVPEPATTMLLISGGLMVLRRRKNT